MILQALTRYYEDLLAQGKIDAPGWAPVKISFALYLDENGGLTQVVPTMEDVTKGKKTVQNRVVQLRCCGETVSAALGPSLLVDAEQIG